MSLTNNNKVDLIAYIKLTYGLPNFISWIINWIEVQEWDFPTFILTEIPNEYLKKYTKELILYRGMVVCLSEVSDLIGCSWSSDFDVAKSFSEQENYYDILADDFDVLHSVVYMKKGKGVDFSTIIKDIYKEVKKSGCDIKDLELLNEVYIKFKKEKEYFSDFKLKDVTIKYCKEIEGYYN